MHFAQGENYAWGYIHRYILYYALMNRFTAVKAENFLLWTPQRAVDLKPVLDSEPSPTVSEVEAYETVLSQPLTHHCKWNDRLQHVADWLICLENFGHG